MSEYVPEPMPSNLQRELQEYLMRELMRISRELRIDDEEFATLEGLVATNTANILLRALQTASPENIIVNGGMWWSQENGYTASTIANYYPADEWRVTFVTSTGVISSGLVAVATPKGGVNRLRCTVTTADTSIAAGEYFVIQNFIEGFRLLDLAWGTAAAKPFILRFGFKGPAEAGEEAPQRQ